ncbi:MAG: AsmA family protein [Odoribacteraceae bacterium]|jgi:hypothetical protein|nr:AsmA family protein [Odoribacteraceae bacterium]
MKKTIIITLSTLLLLAGALVVIPFFFQDDIRRLIENQSSRYLRGRLSIGKMKMNMFENFPNLNVTLTDVMLAGAGGENDTLLLVPRFEASVNLKSLVVGDEIIINRILLDRARLSPGVDAGGRANWDILVVDEGNEGNEGNEGAEGSGGDGGKGESSIRLHSVAIERLSLAYSDVPGDLHAGVEELSLWSRGNFSGTNALLELRLQSRGILLRAGNVAWVNRLDLDGEATIEANPGALALEIKQGDFRLNDLALRLAGSIAATDAGYLLDLSAEAPGSRFEELAALAPPEYRALLAGATTTGTFRLRATAKGEYREDHLPALDLQLAVANASLKYPDLPGSIEQINLDLRVENPGGSVAATIMEMNKLSLVIAGNPLEASLRATNPEDLQFSGAIRGTILLESLQRALPLDGMTIEGLLSANLAVSGKYEHVEKGQHEKLVASGQLSVKDFLLKNEQFPGGAAIQSGKIDVAPTRLKFSGFQVKINSSDARLDGQLDNYLPYLFKGQPLEGSFTLASSLLDLNELYGGSSGSQDATTTAATVVEVPANLNLALDARVNTLLLGELVVKNISGQARTNAGVAALKGLNMELLNGQLSLDGTYNAADVSNPAIDFRARAVNIDLDEAYHSFSFVREAFPMALHCRGKVSAVTRLAARLDQEMAPVMTTLDGGGTLSIADVLVNGNPALDQLALLLHNEEISRLKVSNLDVRFQVERGNLSVEPFTTRLAGFPATISGKQSVTGEMDYTLSVNIDRARFGKDIEKLLAPLPGSANIKNVDVDVNVGGTLAKPTFALDLSRVMKTVEKAVVDQAKENIQKEALKGLEKLFKKK